jgi:hypothetical protein
MERRVTVEFGPSRSKRFGKAVAEARDEPLRIEVRRADEAASPPEEKAGRG